MDGLCARAPRSLENQIAAKVAVLRARPAETHGLVEVRAIEAFGVRVRIHADGMDAELTSSARDATSDFSAIRDQQPREHRYRLPGPGLGTQPGARFSRKAAMPSRPSGDTRA